MIYDGGVRASRSAALFAFQCQGKLLQREACKSFLCLSSSSAELINGRCSLVNAALSHEASGGRK